MKVPLFTELYKLYEEGLLERPPNGEMFYHLNEKREALGDKYIIWDYYDNFINLCKLTQKRKWDWMWGKPSQNIGIYDPNKLLKLEKMKEDKLEGWVFIKKEGIWYATIRDNYFALFNGINDKVLSHKYRTVLENKINNLKTK